MITSSPSETQREGMRLARTLLPGSLVALFGDLGAGKTTLVKGIITELTSLSMDEIPSPTFTYLHTYEATPPIFHFDLYRLQNASDFTQMGFLDYFSEGGICLIEWPERIASILPKNTLTVTLSHLENGRRKIDVCES
ncbi:MAG: tRNA threonylcarbamoyladenosine biosynthesis protein TsaE [Chlamydiae bacterium]|nr:tRNA threonylcarbamoyladenosine biosynthesis protein TsaE [Chlamydiota bacterium]